jgi:hypothetical protein
MPRSEGLPDDDRKRRVEAGPCGGRFFRTDPWMVIKNLATGIYRKRLTKPDDIAGKIIDSVPGAITADHNVFGHLINLAHKAEGQLIQALVAPS